jgi:hypothetical protein
VRAGGARGLWLCGAAFALGAVACGPQGFDPANKVTSVRILAVKIDPPLPAPGEQVNLELLAHPGPTGTAKLYWLPIVCANPPDDLYYACFSALLGRNVAGTSGAPRFYGVLPDGTTLPLEGGTGLVGGASSAASLRASSSASLARPAASLGLTQAAPSSPIDLSTFLQPGTDLTPILREGPRFSYRVPDDVITSRAPVPGAPEPYGITFTFDIACNGTVRVRDPDQGIRSVQPIPFGCYGPDGTELGPEDYVVGFTRTYSYASQRNNVPRIAAVTFEGAAVDTATGIRTQRCTESTETNCPKKPLEVAVSPEDQEVLPNGGEGEPRERIWAQFFTTGGRFVSDTRVLYDPVSGAIPNSFNELQAPREPGTYTIWVVVRDSRAGVTWVTFPLVVE